MPAAPGSLRRRVVDALRERFAVDVRALAALRVALGALVLADLALRARFLTAFYSDAGAVPRTVLRATEPAGAALSLHASVGATWAQAGLFALAGGAALALIAGYRTTLATGAVLVLTVSLQARNPLVLNGGDLLLRRLLLWGLFVPLGARWSLDAAARGDESSGADRARSAGGEPGPTGDGSPSHAGTVCGVGTVALLGQVVVVYATNAVGKLRGGVWLDGSAARTIFALDRFTTGVGEALATMPALLAVGGTVWLALLCGSPLLIALRGRARTALAAVFVGAHAAMAVTMTIGYFPLVSIAALLPFLGPAVWDRLTSVGERVGAWAASHSWPGVVGRVADSGPQIAARIRPRWAGRDVQLIAPGRLPTGGATSSGRAWLAGARTALLVALLVGAGLWNAVALGAVSAPEGAPETLSEPRWHMFAPAPPGHQARVVAPATTADGERVQALRAGPFADAPPPVRADAYPDARWRKYLDRLRKPEKVAARAGLAAYLCRYWQTDRDVRLRRLSLVSVERPVQPDGLGPERRDVLGRYDCLPTAAA